MTQNQRLIQHFKKTGRITQRQALMDYSIQSLTRRIRDLRDMGYPIVSKAKRHPVSGQRYVEYSLQKGDTRSPARIEYLMDLIA